MSSPSFLVFLLMALTGHESGHTAASTLYKVHDGMASYYSSRFHGRRTASGEVFNNNNLTAAHKTLPLNTMLEITNLANSKKVIVRVNDRGPHSKSRTIDLSKAAAKEIEMISQGVAKVSIRVVGHEGKISEELVSSSDEVIKSLFFTDTETNP